MVTFSSLHVAVAASCLCVIVHGFVIVPNSGAMSNAVVADVTKLFGRRARGGLGSIDAEETGGSSTKAPGPRRSMKQQRKSGSSRKKKAGTSKNDATSSSSSSEMSPDLAKFLQQTSDGGVVEAEVVSESKTRRGGRDRRQKQDEQKTIDKERSAKIRTVLDKLDEVLESRTGKVSDILTVVEELLEIPSGDNGDLRRLLLGKERLDYRLAWVGSDEALCHVGTGLHKVPLARMKEVFMNCLGKNKIEILEVISILGPFPNVKNVLQGTTTTSSGISGAEMRITYDKMFDGTGKEINAGTEDNIRRVDLDVAFCDERAIVVVMPDDNVNAKPLDNDGKRVLLFVREEDLDEKLEGLRVNEID